MDSTVQLMSEFVSKRRAHSKLDGGMPFSMPK